MDESRPVLVDAGELARILAVSLDTVYAKARSGDIPAIKVGNRWRFDSSAVLAHLAAPRPAWAQSRRSTARKRVA